MTYSCGKVLRFLIGASTLKRDRIRLAKIGAMVDSVRHPVAFTIYLDRVGSATNYFGPW